MYKFIISLLILVSFKSGQALDPRLNQLLNSQGIDVNNVKNLINSPSTNSLSGKTDGSGTTAPPKINVQKLNVNNSSDKTVLNEKAEKIITDSNTKEIQKVVDEINVKDGYFGYNVFSNNPELFHQDNVISIDPDYSIGPGDELILMLWGETEMYETYFVAKDGYLFLPNVGRVFVNGLNLVQLEKKLLKVLKKVYSSLDGSKGEPTSFFDVSLGSSVFRPMRAFVLGEVSNPGAYNFKQSSSLFSSIFYFGGPNVSGSLRDIRLIRNEKVIGTIDLYNYLLEGKKTDDISLQRNDIIFIPKRLNRVKVSGDINKQLYFELRQNEGLIDLIEFAGGLKPTTHLDRVRVDRILPYSQRKPNSPSKTSIDIDLKKILSKQINFSLIDGDQITFFRIDESYTDVVQINGAVKRSGRYELTKNLTLKDLVVKSDGLLGNAFMDRARIIRKNMDLSESIILVNLDSAMSNDEKNNIQLLSNDRVTIFNKEDMIYKTGVSIEGHVKSPGQKTFYEGMKLIDLIMLGGGFDNENHLANTYFERADLIYTNTKGQEIKLVPFRLDSVLAKKDIAFTELEMGIKVKIYSYSEIYGMPPNSVKISGKVKQPGIYEIVEDFKITDLLFLAGGFKDSVFSNYIYLDRFDLFRINEDNLSKDIISFNLKNTLEGEIQGNNFKLIPGDEIVIYSKSNFVRRPKVSISGIIERPGEYDLKNGMGLRDLIIEAGGVPYSQRKFRADIISLNRNYKIGSDEPFVSTTTHFIDNKISIFKGSNSKILLKDYDKLVIRRDPNVQQERNVTIGGEVLYPGEYSIVSSDEKVSDIIKRAGGLTKNAFPVASSFERNGKKIRIDYTKLIKSPRSRYNIVVQSGDRINLGGKTNLVEIKGAVNNPGFYQYVRGVNFEEYVQLAGGYKSDASQYEAYVEYPDGTAAENKVFSLKNTAIYDSSVLHIPTKKEKAPFSLIDTLKGITTIASDFTQQYLILLLLSQQINQS